MSNHWLKKETTLIENNSMFQNKLAWAEGSVDTPSAPVFDSCNCGPNDDCCDDDCCDDDDCCNDDGCCFAFDNLNDLKAYVGSELAKQFEQQIFEYWVDDFDLHWSFLGLPQHLQLPETTKRVFYNLGIEAEAAVEEYKWIYDTVMAKINEMLDG